MLVIDASIIVKIFVPEAEYEAAAALFASEADLIVPSHALAEVGEVLVCKAQRGEIATQQLDEILSNLPGRFASFPIETLLPPATRFSLQTGASVYDCHYVALAVERNCDLVTADRRLIAKMAGTPYAGLMKALDSFSGPA